MDLSMTHRTCNKCNTEKPLEDYEPTKTGYRKTCKQCRNEARAQRKAKGDRRVKSKVEPVVTSKALPEPLQEPPRGLSVKDKEGPRTDVLRKNEEIIKALKDSFPQFCASVWQYLKLPPPTEVQIDIAKFLSNPKIDRKMVQAFRGVGKSYLTCAYVLWRLWKNPFLNILVVSASKDRADEFSKFCKSIISQVPYLNHLTPSGELRDSNVAFDVGPIGQPGQFPSVKSMGITSQITGSRADLIVADDVEVPNNSMTPDMREKLQERVKEFSAIVKPGGTILYLGTPQTEESLYTQLPSSYRKFIWPVQVPERKNLKLYTPYLTSLMKGKFEELTSGEPLDPLRFSHGEVSQRHQEYGLAGFQLQFMLNTSLSDRERFPLRLRDLLVLPLDINKGPMDVLYDTRDERQLKDVTNVGLSGDRFFESTIPPGTPYAEYEKSIMAIDPSGTGVDETSYCVLKLLNGFIFVLAWGGLQGTGYSEENLRTLCEISKRFNARKIIVEDNFGDGTYRELMKPVMDDVYGKDLGRQVSLEGFKSTTMKEQRICDTLEPIMLQRRLVMSKDIVRDDYASIENLTHVEESKRVMYSGFYQMTHVQRLKDALKVDDRIDVLEMGVSEFVNSMARDKTRGIEQYQEDAFKKHMEKFQEGISRGTVWRPEEGREEDYGWGLDLP